MHTEAGIGSDTVIAFANAEPTVPTPNSQKIFNSISDIARRYNAIFSLQHNERYTEPDEIITTKVHTYIIEVSPHSHTGRVFLDHLEAYLKQGIRTSQREELDYVRQNGRKFELHPDVLEDELAKTKSLFQLTNIEKRKNTLHLNVDLVDLPLVANLLFKLYETLHKGQPSKLLRRYFKGELLGPDSFTQALVEQQAAQKQSSDTPQVR